MAEDNEIRARAIETLERVIKNGNPGPSDNHVLLIAGMIAGVFPAVAIDWGFVDRMAKLYDENQKPAAADGRIL